MRVSLLRDARRAVHARAAVGEPSVELERAERLGEHEALDHVAADRRQPFPRIRGLDALGDDADPEVATEIDGWLEEMIWRIVSRYAELAGAEPALPGSVLYGILDGLFQQALIAVNRGHDDALDELRELVRHLLPTMVRPPLRA